MKCACGRFELKPKKNRQGKPNGFSVHRIGQDEYHGNRACFDISKTNEVIAVRDSDDPLLKEKA